MKKEKPQFIDFANSLLNDNKLENALCLDDFLKDNELAAEKVSKYFWAVKYEKIRICTIAVRENSWWIRFFGRTDGSHELLDLCEKYLTEDTKTLILNNIREPHCKNCNSFISKSIFGKMFDRVCWCTPFKFDSPDDKFLEYAKKIILVCKKTAEDIAKNKVV